MEYNLSNLKGKYTEILSRIEKLNIYKGKVGHIECIRNKGKYRYYLSTFENGSRKRKYIPQKDLSIAEEIIKRDYYNKVEESAKSILYWTQGLMDSIKNNDISQIYENLHPARKEFMEPIISTNKEILLKWKAESFQGKFMDPAYEYLTTKNGEKVRSKSEKILADMFFDNGLVYKYEKPLQIRGNLTLYPDFTFFNPLTDQEIYWEHFGMMDDPQYVNNFIQKITSLNKNGIILGKNLIVTFESSRKILDQDYVKTLINSYLSTCK